MSATSKFNSSFGIKLRLGTPFIKIRKPVSFVLKFTSCILTSFCSGCFHYTRKKIKNEWPKLPIKCNLLTINWQMLTNICSFLFFWVVDKRIKWTFDVKGKKLLLTKTKRFEKSKTFFLFLWHLQVPFDVWWVSKKYKFRLKGEKGEKRTNAYQFRSSLPTNYVVLRSIFIIQIWVKQV